MSSVPPNAYRPAFIATSAGWRARSRLTAAYRTPASHRTLAGVAQTVAAMAGTAWPVAPLLPHRHRNANASLQAVAGARDVTLQRASALQAGSHNEPATASWPVSIAFVAGTSGWLVGGLFTSLVDGTLAWLLGKRVQ